MAAQQKMLNTLFVLVAALFCIIAVIQGSPVAKLEDVAEAQSPDSEGSMREGRFYGLGGSQASSFASANAGATGLGLGYPYGGGVGLAQSSATASAGAGAIGYPYGK